ncbi:MAG: fibronectin type III domain-containing protein, partial [Patescibacteria group bacterium]|nr:fibronectin type III domain-containing protein [Patescibacteria group bacterium]
MTIQINRTLLITILIIALVLAGFYASFKAIQALRRFTALVYSPLDREVEKPALGVPGKIENIAAAAGDKTVSLAWSAPDKGKAAITHYRIYRSAGSKKESFLDLTKGLSYIDGNVENNVVYYYWISAVNDIGEGPLSSAVKVIPKGLNANQVPLVQPTTVVFSATAPFVITNLASAGGDSLISLAWSTPYNGGRTITHYKIYRRTANEAERFIANSYITVFTDFGLVNGVRYYYRVTAVNAIGESFYSNETSNIPRAITPVYQTIPVYQPISYVASTVTREPDAITNLSARVSDARIILSWSAPYDGGESID